MGKQWQAIFLGSKISADGDCSHEIKRHLLLGRKVMTKLVRSDYPPGHSGPILTLSNAARASLPSARLLMAGVGVFAASPLGELVGLVICGFCNVNYR